MNGSEPQPLRRPQLDPALPSATVLLTDIEGYGRRIRSEQEAMRSAMSRHDELMRAAVEAHGGHIYKERGEGDSVLAWFSDPSAGLAGALSIQRAFAEEDWPTRSPLRVRIGLHYVTESSDQEWTIVTAARLRAMASGGQTLVAEALLSPTTSLPASARTHLVGEIHLKDVGPVVVHEVFEPDVQARGEPPERQFGGLPSATTSFVGRRDVMEAIGLSLRQRRLVTILGPGGCGKSRLASEIVRRFGYLYRDRGSWVNLRAVVASGGLLPRAVADALGVEPSPGESAATACLRWLRGREYLLVLDNCEHVLAEAGPFVDSALRDCAGLTVLATSRQPLGVQAEQRWPLGPLRSARASAPSEAILASEAVRLLEDRVRFYRPGFAISHDEAPVAHRICAVLGGLPLAIELVAAQAATWSLSEIAGGLAATEIDELGRTFRDSYERLAPADQDLFDRLSMFPGPWDLADAEAVMPPHETRSQARYGLERLVGSSMVHRASNPYESSYFDVLEPLRDFGQAHLSAARADELRRAISVQCLARVSPGEAADGSESEGARLNRLDRAYPNIRASLQWCSDLGWTELGLALTGALLAYWESRGRLSEGRSYSALFVEAPDAAAFPAARAAALKTLGVMAWYQDDLAAARHAWQASLELHRGLGDRQEEARLLNNLGNLEKSEGSEYLAERLFEQSLAIKRELGDVVGSALSTMNLALIHMDTGRMSSSRRLLDSAIRDFRSANAHSRLGLALANLGTLELMCGEFEAALGSLAESRALREELADERGVADSDSWIALVHLLAGNPDEAASKAATALEVLQRVGDRQGEAQARDVLGSVAMEREEFGEAAKRFEECLAIGRETGVIALTARAHHRLAELALRTDRSRADVLAHLTEDLRLWRGAGEQWWMVNALELAARVMADERPDLAALVWRECEAWRRSVGAPRPALLEAEAAPHVAAALADSTHLRDSALDGLPEAPPDDVSHTLPDVTELAATVLKELEVRS